MLRDLDSEISSENVAVAKVTVRVSVGNKVSEKDGVLRERVSVGGSVFVGDCS